MAKIMNVDYEAIPAQVKQMRTYGQELNSELISAYKSIADMHNVWYGIRYNALVRDFNRLVLQINELLELVVGEIPFALETIANNYSQADKGLTVTGAVKTTPKKIHEISESYDVGMKFFTNEVTAVQKSVSNNLKNARDKMNTIETVYAKIKWQSEAAEAFKMRFQKLKNDIVKAFEDIDKQFTICMNQALQDMQRVEKANTVE